MTARITHFKRTLFLWVVAGALSAGAPAHATFSIVAVDTTTGVIGSAGASCIANSFIISDIIEGIGAAHTQALWLQQNKDSLHQRMLEGLTPDSALAWMVANDATGTAQDRQYLMVTLAGPGASAAFTGADNTNFKGHLFGPGYAIAGNILNGLDVLDDMEAAFLATNGPMEDKLMAALQGAKRVGADNRCTASGKSAISAFIKVVHPGDGPNFYLQEIVPTTTGSTDPIDVLQGKVDAWKVAQQPDPFFSQLAVSEDSIPASGASTSIITVTPRNSSDEPPSKGVDSVIVSLTGEGTLSPVVDNGDGTFSVTLTSDTVRGTATVTAEIFAGVVSASVAGSPSVFYFLCGDADNSGAVNIADVTYLIARIFSGGPAPIPEGAGDADGSGAVNIADVTYLITRIFGGGPAPVCP